MAIFGIIPPEPLASRDIDTLAPKFRAALLFVLPDLADLVRETWRSDQRQRWLYGFGRQYDDDRGVVTNAPDDSASWHCFGLAVDLIEPPGPAVQGGLRGVNIALGMDWPTFKDYPHLQWGAPMRRSPSSRAMALYESGGFAAVWAEVGAA